MDHESLSFETGPNPQAYSPNPYTPRKNPEEKSYIGVFIT